ncbi:probable BOI-related E3 ubiquitin-protein ligase 3 isoform X2 [Hibiscus syriacus]|uniref:probable BOI-related E3 ubiquitin-protein ligase 3 isoform X2 n=1 Tax=Hibiscus syriacus TaxID=106335 RepID=UPI00192303DE|nr:probable BOI-related E3 ubiquitin-protein ligase 3 isoform X2 [Hibiscus syriacus]
MAFPQHQFQQHYQPQQEQSKNFRNFYAIDGQVSPPLAYYSTPDLLDSSPHPPYVPPYGSDGGADLQWNNGVESKRKKLKEQDLLENNSQISSVDFFQARSVSTGLGLSLDNNNRMASSVDSPLLSLIGGDLDLELQRQDAEIDRLLKAQGDRLRQAVLEKVQSNQLQTISLVEERVFQKLREKEAEVENINKKNMELEKQMEQLTMEAGAWQQRARYNENMITALKFNLQQAYAQSRDSKEGCGDSEVDDTASCCNGRAIDFHLISKENSDVKELTCKVCGVNEVCMLLLPCKHLCLCKSCESKFSFCPLCQSSKFIGMEVFM